jgi:hypothetical protein
LPEPGNTLTVFGRKVRLIKLTPAPVDDYVLPSDRYIAKIIFEKGENEFEDKF